MSISVDRQLIQKHQKELCDSQTFRDVSLGVTSVLVLMAISFIAISCKVETYFAACAVVCGGAAVLSGYLSYEAIRDVKRAEKDLENDRHAVLEARLEGRDE